MRIYVSGPMTGMPDLNFPAFNRVADKLRAEGHDVINPAEIYHGCDSTWEQCLRGDIAALVTCDAITFLPGHERSRGARLERHIAVELGMTLMYVSEATL
jgi:hypothetical protein